MIPYSEKVWQGECLANLPFSSIWQKKVWRMNRSAKELLIVTITLDGFSLVKCRRFTKFSKIFTHQTSRLYGIYIICDWICKKGLIHASNFVT